MVNGIIGKKLGMTQLFSEDGSVTPVTVIKAGPCIVVQKKTVNTDGYDAVQLGLVEEKPPRRINKPTEGHFKRAGMPPTRVLREVRIEASDEATSVGDKILVGIFNDRVDCAVAELDISRGTSPTILGIPQAVLTTTSARPGLLVRKSGANGLGLGVIIGTESDPVVAVGGAPRTFIDQIEIVPRPGHQTQFKTGEMDSGALWVSDDDGRIIGLHFAGSPGRALANPIAAVVEALADRGISLGF